MKRVREIYLQVIGNRSVACMDSGYSHCVKHSILLMVNRCQRSDSSA